MSPARLLSLLLSCAPLAAQIPDGVTLTPVFGTDGANLFTHPAMMAEIPGQPGRFAVPEMGTGKIWILAPAAPGSSAYAKTLFGQVSGLAGQDDMGLQGIAFHPGYAENRKYYVKYGSPQRPPRQLRIDERTASADLLHDSGQPARRLLTVDEPEEFGDHNGGAPAFGPDGFLYLNFGDGGWDQVNPDPHGNGQNRETLLAKILRIDVDHKDPGLEYAIPKDNPFVADANPKVRREIYAYGVRNPYRLSFDRITGELYVADIGYTRFDEIDIVKKGGNYGWSLKEGTFCLPDGPCAGLPPIEEPAAILANGGGPGMAKCIIGGQVYRGDPASAFYGVYLFGDHTMKKLFAWKKPESGTAAVKEYPLVTPQEPIAFAIDAMNNIYMVGFLGTIYKLTHEQLKPGITPVGIAARGVRRRGRRSLILSSAGGGLSLPPGFEGPWEAFALDGTRLGILGPGKGSVQGTQGGSARSVAPASGRGDGIVVLRPWIGR
ncbi:MAG: glucose sorbosone dehydrogenase [Fibrobacteres bacterium]|nr:glucose sorbosone dehydrogenase [Fibrobacterota bacterium]